MPLELPNIGPPQTSPVNLELGPGRYIQDGQNVDGQDCQNDAKNHDGHMTTMITTSGLAIIFFGIVWIVLQEYSKKKLTIFKILFKIEANS